MEIEFVIAPPPGYELAALEQIPLLRSAYSRGRVATDGVGTAGYWFARLSVARQSDWPAAPYRLPAGAADGAGPSAYWLCADPVHLQLDRDQLLLDPAAVADLSAQEAQRLADDLNRHFAGEGLKLHPVSPLEWVLQVARALDLAALPPWLLAGRPAGPAMPRGADAAWARRIANETQMLLHSAAVNSARESAGKMAVNSLWLWGGGTRAAIAPAPVRPRLGVFSAQKHVRGLADASGAVTGHRADSWPGMAAVQDWGGIDKALIDLTNLGSRADWPAALQADWLSPAQHTARSTNMQFYCTLLSCGKSATARLYTRDLAHLFRRNSLAQYVDNGQNSRNA